MLGLSLLPRERVLHGRLVKLEHRQSDGERCSRPCKARERGKAQSEPDLELMAALAESAH